MSDCCNNFEFVSRPGSFEMEGGIRGADGVTYFPHVSADGVLSWTNDGGKPNPEPVYIKGADGTPGKSAYAAAQEAGFTGTETEFNAYLSGIGDLTQEVADQKSVFEEVTTTEEVYSANINNEVYEFGRFTAAGAEFADNSAFRNADYLPVDGGKTIVVYCRESNFIRIVQYDSSKTVIVATTQCYCRPTFYDAQLVLNANTSFIRMDTYGSVIGAQMEGAKIGVYYSDNYPAQYLPYEAPHTVIKLKNSKADILKRILSGGINIKIVGDSIAQGVGGTGFAQDGDYIGDFFGEPAYRNPHGYCWANLFENYLESGLSCNVVNNAVLGTSFVELNESFDILVSNTDDVVLCAYGTNNRSDIGVLPGIVQNCIRKFRDAGIDALFLLPIPASVTNEQTQPAHIEQICNALKSIFLSENVPYVDINQIMLDYCDLKGVTIDSLLADGLHPNDTGYLVMFKEICKGIGITRKVDGATW